MTPGEFIKNNFGSPIWSLWTDKDIEMLIKAYADYRLERQEIENNELRYKLSQLRQRTAGNMRVGGKEREESDF